VRVSIVSAAIVLAASVAATATVRPSQATKPVTAQTVPTPEEEEKLARAGEELTEKVCSTACHGIDKIYEKRRTARDWSDVMTSMATLGAQATDAEFATIKRYLTRYYAVVPVNTAPAEELTAVLGLSPKDARLIVDYRTANGRFTDTAALLKVPGIDKSKIEAQPEALVYR
jgi:competence ComEA-like helix-hairpin-helix protein